MKTKYMKRKNLILPIVVLVALLGIFVYVLLEYSEPGPILHDCLIACPDGTQVECGQKCPSILVKISGGSAALVAECSNKSYIYDTADVIVIGTVNKVETKQEDMIYTYSNISIENFGKGRLNSNTITIKTPGGCVGTSCMFMEDQPFLYENKLVRIYLKQTEFNEFSIVCGIMGVEEVGRI